MGRKKFKSAEHRNTVTSLKKNVAETAKMLDEYIPQSTGLLRLAMDLYMTSEQWLFTEENKADHGKLKQAVEDFGCLLAFHSSVRTETNSLFACQQKFQNLLRNLRHTKDEDTASREYIEEILPIIVAIPENYGNAILKLTNVRKNHIETMKATLTPGFVAFFEDLLEQAAINVAQLEIDKDLAIIGPDGETPEVLAEAIQVAVDLMESTEGEAVPDDALTLEEDNSVSGTVPNVHFVDAPVVVGEEVTPTVTTYYTT